LGWLLSITDSQPAILLLVFHTRLFREVLLKTSTSQSFKTIILLSVSLFFYQISGQPKTTSTDASN
jgi:hypothetical protein